MTRDLRIARFLIMRGWPLPVDLQTRLLSEGVDIDRLESSTFFNT